MASTVFLPFLPHDNWLLEENTSEVLEIVNSDLGELLGDIGLFWQAVQHNASLHQCLSSYLQFGRRLHDEAITEASASSDLLQQLHRRVFMVFLRMVTVQPGGPSAQDQASMLYNAWLLDMPKLLDIAVLYGRDNPALVKQLMQKAFTLQPLYGKDAAEMVPLLLSNLSDVAAALQGAAGELRSGNEVILQSLSDGIMYWEDGAETIAAFVEAFPPGAGLLMQSKGAVVVQLASVHDNLLPDVNASLARLSSAVTLPLRKRLARLRTQLQRLAHLLIRHACLGGSLETPAKAAAAWKGLNRPQSPAARGELLAGVLTEVSQQDVSSAGAGSMLHSLEQRYGLGGAISAAVSQAHVSLDPVQHDYLLALLGSAPSSSSRPGANGHPKHPSSTSGGVADAEQASRIAAIKDLFPDYGEGFLAACLSALGQDPERVINALLEGSLPPQLSALDPAMPVQTAPAQSANGNVKAAAEGSGSSRGLSQLSWQSLSLRDAPDPPVPLHASSAPQRQQASTSKAVHKGVSRFLDRAEAADRVAIRAHAQQAQYDEYDDEYDDSFDDLGGPSADGIADVEGDDAERTQGVRGAQAWSAHASSGPEPQETQKGNPGARPAKPKVNKVWVHEGRFYNYAKPGSTEYSSAHSAAAATSAAKAAAEAIHGLGQGGNVPIAAEQREATRDGPAQAQPAQAASSAAAGPGQQSSSAGRSSQQGGRGGGGAPSRGRGSHAHKDQHKAAIANHHRKDRALRKQGGPAPGGS